MNIMAPTDLALTQLLIPKLERMEWVIILAVADLCIMTKHKITTLDMSY